MLKILYCLAHITRPIQFFNWFLFLILKFFFKYFWIDECACGIHFLFSDVCQGSSVPGGSSDDSLFVPLRTGKKTKNVMKRVNETANSSPADAATSKWAENGTQLEKYLPSFSSTKKSFMRTRKDEPPKSTGPQVRFTEIKDFRMYSFWLRLFANKVFVRLKKVCFKSPQIFFCKGSERCWFCIFYFTILNWSTIDRQTKQLIFVHSLFANDYRWK